MSNLRRMGVWIERGLRRGGSIVIRLISQRDRLILHCEFALTITRAEFLTISVGRKLSLRKNRR